MAGRQPISTRVADAVSGGGGIPGGVTVTIMPDTGWVLAKEAGDKYVTKGRSANDPVLKLVLEDSAGTVMKPEYLSAGKAKHLEPSDDGQLLYPAEGSAATGLNKNCGAAIFFDSLEDKKRHKLALDPTCRDDGIKGIYGVTFVTGRKVIQLEGLQPFSALVADQIVSINGVPKKKKPRDEDEDEAPPKKAKKPADDDEDDDAFEAEAVAEETVKAALELPKYRKGIAEAKLYTAVFDVLKESELTKAQKAEVLALVDPDENPKWAKSSKRPWEFDEDDDHFKGA